MKKIFFLLMISFSSSVFSNCYDRVVKMQAESCKSSQKVGTILNCVNNIGANINSCKQEMDKRKIALVYRKDKILIDEITKIEKSSKALMITGVNGKQDARYTALKQLNVEFLSYSDSLKSAIARTNSAYNEFKTINLNPLTPAEKLITITKLERIIKKISSETRNAQIYFNESKSKFLGIEALLQIDIVEGALIPVTNLKNQNNMIIGYIQEAIDQLKIIPEFNRKSIVNFPSSFEKLVRESENQEVGIEACDKNNSKECSDLIEANQEYREEVIRKILSSKAQIESIGSLELKNKILEAQKNNDLIEYGRLYDLAVAAGAIE